MKKMRPLYGSRPTNGHQPPAHPPAGNGRGVDGAGHGDNSIDVPAVIAAGKRPDPFRTRKLSPPAPMVLPSSGGGRVGHRRTLTTVKAHPTHIGVGLHACVPLPDGTGVVDGGQ